MATKISELNTSVTAVANDLFITVTDTANTAAIETKKITLQGLANSLPGILNITGSGGLTVNATADANVIALSVNISGSNGIVVDTSTNTDNIALSVNSAAITDKFTSFTMTDPNTAVTFTQNASSNDSILLQTGTGVGLFMDANNTYTIASRIVANGTNIEVTSNTNSYLVNVVDNPSIVGNTTLGTNSTNITTFNSIPILPILSAPPGSPVTGMLVIADYTNWDPTSSVIPRPYPVFYDGAVWQPLY